MKHSTLLILAVIVSVFALLGCNDPKRNAQRATDEIRESASDIRQRADNISDLSQDIAVAVPEGDPLESIIVPKANEITEEAREISKQAERAVVKTQVVTENLVQTRNIKPWYETLLELGLGTILTVVGGTLLLVIAVRLGVWPVIASTIGGAVRLIPALFNWLVPKTTQNTAKLDYEALKASPDNKSLWARVNAARRDPLYDAAYRRAKESDR
jgi:outer membrane murein-binding lipoprotein Lpp